MKSHLSEKSAVLLPVQAFISLIGKGLIKLKGVLANHKASDEIWAAVFS